MTTKPNLTQSQVQQRQRNRKAVEKLLPRSWKQSGGNPNFFYGPDNAGLQVYYDRLRYYKDVRYVFEGKDYAVPVSEDELQKIIG